MPLFSIVVPVHNGEKHLNECLESVMRQSFSEYEVVVVNDGSEDKSGEIAEGFACRYPDRFVVVHQPNLGCVAARLSGFAASSGEYIVSLDSDDLLRQDALEVLVREVGAGAPDIVAFGMSRSKDYSFTGSYFPYSQVTRLCGDGRSELFSLAFRTFALNDICGKAVRSSLLKGLDLSGDVRGVVHGEGFILMMSILGGVGSFVYLPDRLYYYRPNPCGVSRIATTKVVEDLRVIDAAFSAIVEQWAALPGTNLDMDARAARSLRSFFNYFDSISCQWRRKEAAREIGRVAEDGWYRGYVANERALGMLRADRRLCLRVVNSGRYGIAVRAFRAARHLRSIARVFYYSKGDALIC